MEDTYAAEVSSSQDRARLPDLPRWKVYKNFCAAADRAMALQRGTYCGKNVVLNRSGAWSTYQEFSEKFPGMKFRITDFYMHNV